MNKKLELSNYIESIYKNYSYYVLESRAIPDWTGLKRSQIKILWVGNKHCRKVMKTLAFTGAIVLHGGYHHSPDALADTVAKMAQDFCGSNNLPLVKGFGSFGCQTIPDGVAAPRYTEVQLSDVFDYVFPKDDFNIAPESPDPENPEPEYLLPILPISLLNGIQGIAVGYANKVFPRKTESLIKAAIQIIQNKKVNVSEMLPYFNDYRGEITESSDGKVVITGRLSKQPKNVILIDEVPFKYDVLGYKEYLYKLKDEGKINSFVDESDGKWKITVNVPDSTYGLSEDDLIQMFDLKMNLNENITIIAKEGSVKVFESALDYLKYFVNIRLNIYNDRKNYLLKENAKAILRTKIKSDLNSELSNKVTKADIIFALERKFGAYRDYFKLIDYSIEESEFKETVKNIVENIKLSETLRDKKSEYESELEKLIDYREKLTAETIENMYIEDLKNFEKYLRKK